LETGTFIIEHAHEAHSVGVGVYSRVGKCRSSDLIYAVPGVDGSGSWWKAEEKKRREASEGGSERYL